MGRWVSPDRLNREWLELAALPVSELGSSAAEVCSAPDLAGLLAAVQERPDPVLLELVRLCQCGSQLAGRVVLQAMLPKLIGLASADARADFDDYLASFWVALHRYPLARRRQRVAANLAWETRRLALADFRPASGQLLPPELERQEDCPTVAEVLTAAAGQGLLDGPSSAVLRSVYEEGLTSSQVARLYGTTSAAVRWRCSRSLEKLRNQRTRLLEALEPEPWRELA